MRTSGVASEESAGSATNLTSMTSTTRGQLPAAVYWRRRLAVLGTLALLVVAVVRTFGDSGADATTKVTEVGTTPKVVYGPPAPTSDTAGAEATDTQTPAVEAAPDPAAATTPTVAATTELPEPTGQCSDDDVVITPSVPDPQATKTVVIDLTLRTEIATACLWQITPESVQLRITSGEDRIWSTIECATAVPDRSLVLRRESDTIVKVKWNARRSDADCSKHTAWALPGSYHLTVSPLGGEPTDLQFELTAPHADPTPAAVADPASTSPADPAATSPVAEPAATTPAESATEPAKQQKKGKKRANLG